MLVLGPRNSSPDRQAAATADPSFCIDQLEELQRRELYTSHRLSHTACNSCCACMGFGQRSAWLVLLGIYKAHSLGGHFERSYFWRKEDVVVKKQLPSLPPHPLPLTRHPKMQCLPCDARKPWQLHGAGIAGWLSLTWQWQGPARYYIQFPSYSHPCSRD